MQYYTLPTILSTNCSTKYFYVCIHTIFVFTGVADVTPANNPKQSELLKYNKVDLNVYLPSKMTMVLDVYLANVY